MPALSCKISEYYYYWASGSIQSTQRKQSDRRRKGRNAKIDNNTDRAPPPFFHPWRPLKGLSVKIRVEQNTKAHTRNAHTHTLGGQLKPEVQRTHKTYTLQLKGTITTEPIGKWASNLSVSYSRQLYIRPVEVTRCSLCQQLRLIAPTSTSKFRVDAWRWRDFITTT